MSKASWDSPATNWNPKPKRVYGKSSSNIVNANWRNIPWDILYQRCNDAAETIMDRAIEQRNIQYETFISKKEHEYSSMYPEHGEYEGNFRDEFPIGEFPKDAAFKLRRKVVNEILTQFALDYNLKALGILIIPQIIEHISTFKLTTVSGHEYDKVLAASSDEGKISGGRLYTAYFSKDSQMLGLYDFLMADSRGSWLDTQYKAPASTYCALVPLIMYAFKKSKGIPYSHWSRKDIKGIVNPKLADAMLLELEEAPSKDECLEARAQGLSTKTGAKAGTLKNPLYTYKLFGNHPLDGLPEYAQTMYSQIWCAHPQNRTKHMILDPLNWDRVPPMLLESEVLTADYSEFSFGQEKVDLQTNPWFA